MDDCQAEVGVEVGQGAKVGSGRGSGRRESLVATVAAAILCNGWKIPWDVRIPPFHSTSNVILTSSTTGYELYRINTHNGSGEC